MHVIENCNDLLANMFVDKGKKGLLRSAELSHRLLTVLLSLCNHFEFYCIEIIIHFFSINNYLVRKIIYRERFSNSGGIIINLYSRRQMAE